MTISEFWAKVDELREQEIAENEKYLEEHKYSGLDGGVTKKYKELKLQLLEQYEKERNDATSTR